MFHDFPWAKGQLRITRAALEAVFEEARQGYARDEESCGLLVGPANDPMLIDEVVPLPNRANALHRLDQAAYPRTGRTYFDLDSLKFEACVKKGHANGRPVKVVYHSHLDCGAYFSETDTDAAKMGGPAPPFPVAHLVTSVHGGAVGEFRLFVWDPETQTFLEGDISVEEP
jgi:proteasome lid subunit RPN8/RPN11